MASEIRENHKSTDEYTIFVIGRKGRDFFKKRNMPITDEVTGVPDLPSFADIKSIAYAAVAKFEQGEYDQLFLVYNQFKNAMTQIPTIKRLLPLDDVSGTTTASYEYEPSPEGVLEVLLPKYAETLIYSAVLEGKASEFGARMSAMNSATKKRNEDDQHVHACLQPGASSFDHAGDFRDRRRRERKQLSGVNKTKALLGKA